MDNKYLPTRKVGTSSIVGFITMVIIWAINTYTGTEVPAEVASAISVIVMALVAYFVPDASTADRRADDAPF